MKFIILMLLSCLIASCSSVKTSTIHQYSDVPKTTRGEVVSSSEYSAPVFIHNIKKIIYYQYTTEGDTGSVVASSLILLPDKPNSKLVVLAHGTIGVDVACSVDKTFPLFLHKGFINPLLKEGYTIVMPNYRGLGQTNATHFYFNAKESGKDLLDAILAAMKLQKIDIETPVVFLGYSQGGHAALSATEMRKSYFPQLNLVGLVLYAALVNFDEMINDILSKKISSTVQYFLLPYVVSPIVRSHSDIHYKDFFSSSAVPKDSGEDLVCLFDIVKMIPISNKWTLHPSDKALEVAVSYYKEQNLPHVRVDTPLMLIRGSKDAVIIDRWSKDYVTKLCSVGDVVEEVIYNGGHLSMAGVPRAVDWIRKRFNQEPPHNVCNTLSDKNNVQ
ncbi:MAG: alpha/beta fold hydrolase [Neisseriaceae bacterium]|nr:MAG: alpha/beta fold hydrolase [Neisseriaceae bacterium]